MNGQGESTNCDYVTRAHQLCMNLNNIMLLINSSHDVEEILHEIVEETCKALGCESARIAIRDGESWVIRYVNNLPGHLLGRSFSDEELPHAALAMITRKPVAIDDAFTDDRTNTELMRSLGIRSVLVLPLIQNDQVTGTLFFGYMREPVVFTDTEIEYAEKVSTGVTIALQNAHLYQKSLRAEEELKESNKLADVLNKIDAVLYSAQDYDTIMKGMLKLATEAIGAETAMIFSKEGDRWVTRYVYRLSRSLIGRSFSNREVRHTAITAATKRSLVVVDTSYSQDVDQKFVQMLGIRSLLDFPLIVKGQVIGDLTFHYHSSPVAFNERQVEFVRKLQNSISLALENARLLEAGKQREFRLKEAEKLGKFGHFHFDRQTARISWSEGMFHIFGRDPTMGEPTIEEFFTIYAVDPDMDEMKQLVVHEQATEFDARVRHGEHCFDLHITMDSIKGGRGNFLARFGTVQDITERKRAEQLLRESETFKQAILDALPAHIAVLDQYGTILAVNRPWTKFAAENGLGDLRSVYPGANYLAVCRLAAEMSDPLALEALAGIEEVLAERSPRFTLNYPCHSPTQQRWFMMNVVRPSHDIRGALITHNDITEQMKAEDEIQEANRELEAFNYTVAHDLRKPLTVINGYVQILAEVCGDRLDEQCKSYLKEAYEGTLHMNRLIDALLNFSQAAHAEPKRKQVNISGICEEVAAELKLAEPERQVTFRIAPGIVAEADPELLRIVLGNLLGNAWKYTDRYEGVIEFGATTDAGPTYFVRDNGPGFDPAEAERLFTPFHRLEKAKGVGGLGIGLATVARIIERHGGKVWAEGKPGEGATFYFTFG